MSHERDVLVDEALRALAADDERVRVSARVHDAVLREWDQQHGVRRRRRIHRQPGRLAWVVVPAAAALMLAAAVTSTRVGTPSHARRSAHNQCRFH